MTRLLAAAALLGGLVATAADPKPSPAAKPKPPRVAVSEPTEAAKDPDFAVQGEYAGELTTTASS